MHVASTRRIDKFPVLHAKMKNPEVLRVAAPGQTAGWWGPAPHVH